MEKAVTLPCTGIVKDTRMGVCGLGGGRTVEAFAPGGGGGIPNHQGGDGSVGDGGDAGDAGGEIGGKKGGCGGAGTPGLTSKIMVLLNPESSV